MYIDLHVNCPLFSSDFNETWIFSSRWRKGTKYKSSWKSVQWKPSCYLRSERTKLIVAFHDFAESPKKQNYVGEWKWDECRPFDIKLLILLGKISGHHKHQLHNCIYDIAKNMKVKCQIIKICSSVCKHRYKQICWIFFFFPNKFPWL